MKFHSLIILFFVSFFGYSQKYTKMLSEMKDDIILTYKPITNGLMPEDLALPKFVREYVVVVSKNRVVFKPITSNLKDAHFTYVDYADKKKYICQIKSDADSRIATEQQFIEPDKMINRLFDEVKSINGINAQDAQYYTSRGKLNKQSFIIDFGMVNVNGTLYPTIPASFKERIKGVGFVSYELTSVSQTKLKDDPYSLKKFVFKTPEMISKEKQKIVDEKQDIKFKMLGEKSPMYKIFTVDNQKYSSKGLEGKNVVFFFWSTQKPPTTQYLDKLNQLKKEYKDVVFFSVAQEDASTLRDFLKFNKFNFSHISDGKWLSEKFELKHSMSTVLIDKTGVIKYYEPRLREASINDLDDNLESVEED